jgi:hypothetical protein
VNKEAKNFVSTTGYTFADSKVGTINENCAANAMVYRNVTAEQYFNGYYDYYNN